MVRQDEPGEVAYEAVLKGDAPQEKMEEFIYACLEAATEDQFVPLTEGGYKGTCMDFILENRGKMPASLLNSLLTTKFDPSARVCTLLGNPAPCYGGIIDFAYDSLEKDKDNKSLRDKIVEFVSKPEVDLSAPLCKIPTGDAVACMQRVIDDARSTVAIERKMGAGQPVVSALKGGCMTLDNHRTSCVDKIFDNLIRYGADTKSEKYPFKESALYQSLVRAMCSNDNMSGIYDLLQEPVFYDEFAEGYVSGYDKILRRLGDRGVAREVLASTLTTLVDTGAIDYERFGTDPNECNHPYTGQPTTCVDTAFSVMYDRSPEGDAGKKWKETSAVRFDALRKLMVSAAKNTKFEDQNCTEIPAAGQGWSDKRTNCISSVIAIPADDLAIAVFDPTRLTSIVSKPCRYRKPDGTMATIPCFEAVLRTAAARNRTSRVDYDPVIRGITLRADVDLSKPCNNIDFSSETSCLDLLMDIDQTNASVEHYLKGAAKAKDLNAFKCSITHLDDFANAFDFPTRHVKNPSTFISGVTGADQAKAVKSDIRVSCLDKMLIRTYLQKSSGWKGVYAGATDARGNRYFQPDYTKIGLDLVTHGAATRVDTPCRYIYPNENGDPVVAEIPCYQKFLEVFMPPDTSETGSIIYRGAEPRTDLYPKGFEVIHKIYDGFDMSKPCKLYDVPIGRNPIPGTRVVPCLAAMYMKYGQSHVMYTDEDGATRMRNRDDLRCSLVGSKHFGKVNDVIKNLAENAEYRDYVGNFKRNTCNNLSCRSTPGGDDIGIDPRSKGKIGKIMYCHCDEHMSPDGKFTPQAATCFEKICYSTVAQFPSNDGMWGDFRKFYAAGDQTPPLVKYTQESFPEDAKLADDIAGVYEVKPRMSPHDFHVRRYITEFSKAMRGLYDSIEDHPITIPVDSINQRKLMEITGKATIDEAVAAAKNLTAEQMNEINPGRIEMQVVPSISLYFMKGGMRTEIPATTVKRASTITEYIIEGREKEVYTKRPEWNPRYTEDGLKAAVNAITAISTAYVESDDKSINIDIVYKDRNGNPVKNFRFDDQMPSREEAPLSKGQMKELKENKEIRIMTSEGVEKIVKLKYNLFSRDLKGSYKLSTIANMEILTPDVKEMLLEASRKAAGMPDKPMYVVITSDPRDVMRASTCQRWGSCIKLEDGGRENTDSVDTYIKAGSYIAFITDDLNNPLWLGRTFIHRSVYPHLLALQDRWTRDCGTEYVYGMPEFRRLLLDTVRVAMHSKGYNRKEIRNAIGMDPKDMYLWADYPKNPARYITGSDAFGEICESFVDWSESHGGRSNATQCTPRNPNFVSFVRMISKGDTGYPVDKAIESIKRDPYYDVASFHTSPERRGVECGTSQEFRVISDEEIAEVKKHRGEDFMKPLGKYVRPYPVGAVTI